MAAKAQQTALDRCHGADSSAIVSATAISGACSAATVALVFVVVGCCMRRRRGRGNEAAASTALPPPRSSTPPPTTYAPPPPTHVAPDLYAPPPPPMYAPSEAMQLYAPATLYPPSWPPHITIINNIDAGGATNDVEMAAVGYAATALGSSAAAAAAVG